MSDPKIIDAAIEQVYTKSSGKTGYRWYTGWKNPPWVVVVHFSAGYTAKQCRDVLIKRGLSTHNTIARNGDIHRHVTDENRGIHAGYGRWGGVSGMNSHALGFEIANFGWAEHQFDPDAKSPYYVYRNKSKSDPELVKDKNGRAWYRDESYKDSNGNTKWTRVLTETYCERFTDHRPEHKDKWWSVYPEDQLQASFWLIWQWVKKFDILLENVVGHEHVTPHRKTDPGPGYPWHRLEFYLERRCQKHKPELLDTSHRTKERIKALQSHCARMGLEVGSIDGIWGSYTANAVEDALETYSPVYGFGSPDITPENVLALCNTLRLVPGFDPGRG